MTDQRYAIVSTRLRMEQAAELRRMADLQGVSLSSLLADIIVGQTMGLITAATPVATARARLHGASIRVTIPRAEARRLGIDDGALIAFYRVNGQIGLIRPL